MASWPRCFQLKKGVLTEPVKRRVECHTGKATFTYDELTGFKYVPSQG
jgi:hypothetical protein